MSEPCKDLRAAWQNQPADVAPVSLPELRRKAEGLGRTVQRRNLREYLAGMLGAVVFGYYFWRFPTPLTRAGAALTIVGALFAMYQLHKRGSAEKVPAEAVVNNCLDFYRHELERQRDLLGSVWSWSLLPSVPGLALFLAGIGVEQLGGRWLPVAGAAAICTVGFFIVHRLNRSAAHGLQAQIDALSALGKES